MSVPGALKPGTLPWTWKPDVGTNVQGKQCRLQHVRIPGEQGAEKAGVLYACALIGGAIDYGVPVTTNFTAPPPPRGTWREQVFAKIRRPWTTGTTPTAMMRTGRVPRQALGQ